MISRREFVKLGAGVGAGMLIPSALVDKVLAQPGVALLDPTTLTKYVDALPIPRTMRPLSPNFYHIGAFQVWQRLHSEFTQRTRCWGYGESGTTASYPAATIEARKGVPIRVYWTNNLLDSAYRPRPHPLQVDPTLHWANPFNFTPPTPIDPATFTYTLQAVPIVTHLHGGEVPSSSDGHPDAWFTPRWARRGPAFTTTTFRYPNEQQAATLWYHDHALGITRLNVHMGLAGFYLLRDPALESQLRLPSGRYEIPLVVQDRIFDVNNQFHFPAVGDNPTIHPFWLPEFFGDTILVNGKVWPNLNVEPRKYRFRVLNGSNARFYRFYFGGTLPQSPQVPVTQIGTDLGYLPTPTQVGPLLLAPGERADLIVDFTGLTPGTTVTVTNDAPSPFPNGADVPDPATTGQIMRFTVVPSSGSDNSRIPSRIPVPWPRLSANRTRFLTLNEVMGANGPVAALLNNTPWHIPTSETVRAGSTEMWEIANLTVDAHPIHLHLFHVRPINRQNFDVAGYQAAYDAAYGPNMPPMGEMPMGPPPTVPSITPFLQGVRQPVAANEYGYKDTFVVPPGQVTRILVRAKQANGAPYGFNPSAGPGYVWHCHILDHEDNEMMRPLKIRR